MAELAAKYKAKIINAAVIILALVIAGNIYKSQAKGLELLRERNQTEAKKNTVLQDISRLEKRLTSYKGFFAKKEAGAIINTLSNLAKESGIKILSIRPGREERYRDYAKLPFELSVNSPDYNAIGKFVSRIENHQDVYLVENLGIRPGNIDNTEKQDTKKQGLEADLTLSTVIFSSDRQDDKNRDKY